MIVELRKDQIKTLISILDHVRDQTGAGASNYSIDTLCRKDCADRWWEIRSLLMSHIDEKKVVAK